MNNNHSEPEIPSANARANGRPAGPAQPVVVHPPAMRELHLAIVGATHLRDFLQPLGLTAYRLLLAEPDRAQIEIEDMRSRREGGLLIDVGNLNDTGTKLANAHEWFSTPLTEKMMEGQPLPAGINLKNDRIAFSISKNITSPTIHAALDAMMKPRCLRTYLSTSAGRERLVVAGHHAGSWFHTGPAHSPRAASAIPLTGMFLVRPRRELPQLVRALSALVTTLRCN